MNTSRPGTPFTLGFMLLLIVLAGAFALAAIWTRSHGLPPYAATFVIVSTAVVLAVAQWQARRRRKVSR